MQIHQFGISDAAKIWLSHLDYKAKKELNDKLRRVIESEMTGVTGTMTEAEIAELQEIVDKLMAKLGDNHND